MTRIRTYGTLLIVSLFAALCSAKSSNSKKSIVDEAVTAIDACYHWGGEVGDQSKERNEEINKGVERDCPYAKEKAEKAYKLYPNNTVLAAKILELIDIGYFNVSDYEKKEICEKATIHFRDEFLKSHQKDFLFLGMCPDQASKLYGQ